MMDIISTISTVSYATYDETRLLMIYLWFTYDLLMIYLWFTYDLLMTTYDLLMIYLEYLCFT